MQVRGELLPVQTLDGAVGGLDHACVLGGGFGRRVERHLTHEEGQMREKVGVRGCYCFVEVDFGLGAGLYYYGAGLVAENAIAGKLISLDKADEMLCYGRVWLCCTTVHCGWC